MGTKATTLSGLSSIHRQSERHFFVGLTLLFVFLVFMGFSRTYYLHSLFKTPKLSMFLHVHGAVMTGWIVLFAVQTFLISSSRTRIHRALGLFGAGYAVLIVVMGCTATVLAAQREVRAHSQFVFSVLTVLALELTQMMLFAFLVTLGVWWRNRTDYHKRLMVLATLCMLPNPMVRLLVLVGVERNIVILDIWASLVVAVALLDALRNRRLHPAFGFGSFVTIAFLYSAYFWSLTSFWQRFAGRAVS